MTWGNKINFNLKPLLNHQLKSELDNKRNNWLLTTSPPPPTLPSPLAQLCYFLPPPLGAEGRRGKGGEQSVSLPSIQFLTLLFFTENAPHSSACRHMASLSQETVLPECLWLAGRPAASSGSPSTRPTQCQFSDSWPSSGLLVSCVMGLSPALCRLDLFPVSLQPDRFSTRAV